ncbi:MAG: heme exporter protein CcmD [Alphaproteobacteria bacterium]
MSDFFHMGGHGVYIWPAYLIATVIVVGILVQTITTMRQRERQLAELRRERRGTDDEDET